VQQLYDKIERGRMCVHMLVCTMVELFAESWQIGRYRDLLPGHVGIFAGSSRYLCQVM